MRDTGHTAILSPRHLHSVRYKLSKEFRLRIVVLAFNSRVVHAAVWLCLLKWKKKKKPARMTTLSSAWVWRVIARTNRLSAYKLCWLIKYLAMVWKNYCINLLIYCICPWAVVCLSGSEDDIGPGDQVIKFEGRHLYLLNQLDSSNVWVLCIFIFIP